MEATEASSSVAFLRLVVCLLSSWNGGKTTCAGDATGLCEQQLKDQRARVQAAAKAAEFPPGSLAGGSLTEQRNMVRARLQECQRLGGWLSGAIGCARHLFSPVSRR